MPDSNIQTESINAVATTTDTNITTNSGSVGANTDAATSLTFQTKPSETLDDKIAKSFAKAFELGEKETAIRRAFWKQFEGQMEWSHWVEAILEQHVIVSDGAGSRWAYPYTQSGVVVTFGEPRMAERKYIFADMMVEGEDSEAKASGDGAGSGSAFADVPDQESVGDGLGFPKEQAKAFVSEHGNALTFIEAKGESDEIRVANYMFMWGSPGEKDLDMEYFSKETDWKSDYTEAMERIPMDWEHARQPDKYGPEGEIPVPGLHDVIAWADMKTAEVDETGLWVERVLNRKSRYLKGVMTLLAAGKLATSTYPIQGQTVKSDDGHIDKWPLYRDSITVTPMEFRMNGELGGDVLQAAKGLYESDPRFREMCEAKGIEFPDEDTGETDGSSRQRMEARLRLAKARLALSN